MLETGTKWKIMTEERQIRQQDRCNVDQTQTKKIYVSKRKKRERENRETGQDRHIKMGDRQGETETDQTSQKEKQDRKKEREDRLQ